MSKHTSGDAVRMVGQLLLARPTTGSYARDAYGKSCAPDSKEACTFCYEGAMSTVMRTLNTDYWTVDSIISDLCFPHEPSGAHKMGADIWDNASTLQRALWSQTMADYKGD